MSINLLIEKIIKYLKTQYVSCWEEDYGIIEGHRMRAGNEYSIKITISKDKAELYDSLYGTTIIKNDGDDDKYEYYIMKAVKNKWYCD